MIALAAQWNMSLNGFSQFKARIFNLDEVNVYEIAIDYKIQFHVLSQSAVIQYCTRGIYHQSENAMLRAKQSES